MKKDNEDGVFELIDGLTLEVAQLRKQALSQEGSFAPKPEFVAALEALIVRHHDLRGVIPDSLGKEAQARTCETEMQQMRKEFDRIDSRNRTQLEKQRKEWQQLTEEVRLRVSRVEARHDALLNGRIFSTLRTVASALGWIGVGRRIATQESPVPATAVESAPPAQPRPVISQPGKLPPPERVKFAGVAYMARPKGGVNATGVTYEGTPLISVVMTCFNTGAFVEKAVQSILSQTWQNLELIAVDDCSTDDTRERLNRLAEHDPRVKVFCFGDNRGTYWCKNFGLTKASGEVLTFMDSDDTSHPERLAEQFKALNVVGRVVSTCNHVRKDIHGETIAINGVVERVAYISQMIKRPVLDEIGYFDTVRTSADDEFLRRIRITYGRDAEVNVKRPLYIALLREGSLTSDPENAINFVQDRNEGQSFLSPQRRHYAACCSLWHQFLDEKGLRPYVPFPVVRRPFPAYGKLVVAGRKYADNHVSASLASYPPRKEKLQAVVSSLLPQVDHLYVYLNEYDEIPEFLRHSRITVELGRSKGELRDNGKFYFMDRIRDGYVFTVDDDIDYPSDYVQRLIQKLEFYDRKAIVGLHGTIYAKPIRSFFKGRALLHFEEALSRDTIVNQLGTGTVAFHTELLRPSFQWFKAPGMADVWFAVETKKLGITQISIQRDAFWAKPLGVEETTLFREFRRNDSVQTAAIRSVTPWKEILRPPLNGLLRERLKRYGPAYGQLLPKAGQEPSALVNR